MAEQKKKYTMQVKKLTKEDIHAKLSYFESKYGMSSREFIGKYNRCEFEEENLEFLDWAGYYDMAYEAGIVSVSDNSRRVAGLHMGAIQISDDFDKPLPDEFWLGNCSKVEGS